MTIAVWEPIGVALTILALLLLGIAIGARHYAYLRKRKRRCPRCWYDMAHSPGRTCSECGRTARSERRLYTLRYRPAIGLLGSMLLVVGIPLQRTTSIAARGWVGGVPSSVLVALCPVTLRQGETWRIDAYRRGRPDDAPPPFVRLATTLDRELAHRAAKDTLPAWPRHVLHATALGIAERTADDLDHAPVNDRVSAACDLLSDAAARDTLTRAHRARFDGTVIATFDLDATWPAGSTMCGHLLVDWLGADRPWRYRLLDDRGSTLLERRHGGRHVFRPHTRPTLAARRLDPAPTLGPAPAHGQEVSFRLIVEAARDDGRWRPLLDRRFTRAVRIVPRVEDAFDGVSTTRLDDAIADFAPFVHTTAVERRTYEPRVTLNTISLVHALAEERIPTFAVTIEVVEDDEVIAHTTACWLRGHTTSMIRPFESRIELEWCGPPRRHFDADRVTVRVRSAPRTALAAAAPRRLWFGFVEFPPNTPSDADVAGSR